MSQRKKRRLSPLWFALIGASVAAVLAIGVILALFFLPVSLPVFSVIAATAIAFSQSLGLVYSILVGLGITVGCGLVGGLIGGLISKAVKIISQELRTRRNIRNNERPKNNSQFAAEIFTTAMPKAVC